MEKADDKIPDSIIESLMATLEDIRNESDGSGGWLSILSVFEKAIEKANNNRYFSIKDASRIYLEFNSDYSSAIFDKIDNVCHNSESFFAQLLEKHIVNNYEYKNVGECIKKITQYDDIFEEFINYILNGETFIDPPMVIVEGYSAKRLCAETILSPLGAFNYLIYLREEPAKALADLKANLPRRRLLNKGEI